MQGHCARARVGEARTFRLDLGLLARRQREDEVDPGGLEVRGRGECPDPAAGYPAGGWAELASASSPAPASSCTASVIASRGQAFYGDLTPPLGSPGATKNTSSLRASVAEALRENLDRAQSTSSSFFGPSRVSPTYLHKGKWRQTSKIWCKPVQAFQREAGEGWFEHANDCDSPLGAT